MLKHFDDVSIYNASTSQVLLAGLARLWTCGFTGWAICFQAPAIVLDPAVDTLWAPFYPLGGLLAWACTVFVLSPVAINIRVRVPEHARQSKAMLTAYLKRLPRDSKVTIQHMRFIPWPMTSTYELSGLRRVPKYSGVLHIATDQLSPKLRERIDSGNFLTRAFFRQVYGRYTLDLRSFESKARTEQREIIEAVLAQVTLIGEAPIAITTKPRPMMVKAVARTAGKTGVNHVRHHTKHKKPPPAAEYKGRQRSGQ